MHRGSARRSAYAVGLVVLVGLVATAGCLGLGDETGEDNEVPEVPTDDEDESSPATLDWWLSDCHAVVGIVPVDETALAEHLPEGFEPVSAEESLGLPPDARGDGALGFETFHCGSSSSLNGSVEDVGYAAIFAPVAPPEDLEHPEADVLFYKWETLVADEERRTLFAEEGLPAVDGSTDLSGFEETPLGYMFDVSATLDSSTFRMTGSAGQPNEDFREGFSFLEFQQGEDGFAMWHSMDNEAAGGNSGTGTVEIDAGHWTTDVIGAEQAQAYTVASPSVDFTEGEILLP